MSIWGWHYWHLRLVLGKGAELLVVTPVGGFWLAHGAYDQPSHRLWTGFLIVWRIRGAKPPHQLYRDIFRREFKVRYLCAIEDAGFEIRDCLSQSPSSVDHFGETAQKAGGFTPPDTSKCK